MSAPSIHSVHIYESSSALITRLCGVVSSSLRVGDAVLVVATAEHRSQLIREVEICGVDIRAHAREGLYTMVDAEELLATFMVNGMPDRDMFEASVGSMLRQAHKSARGSHQGLTVFGEMVAVLWDAGKKDAALQLEALWNDAQLNHSFHLHCAYPRAGFINGDEALVCNMHSHVLTQ